MSEDDKFDYYEVLGLTHQASKQAINSAYKKMALKYHPDKNKDKSAAVLFQQIKKASDILNDDKARAAYDAVIRAKQMRKRRDREMDDKRREMKDTLIQREQAYKRQRAEEELAKKNYKVEVHRVKKEARRRRKREEEEEREREREKERDREPKKEQQQNQNNSGLSAKNSSKPFSSFMTSTVTPAGSHEDLEERVLRELQEAASKQNCHSNFEDTKKTSLSQFVPPADQTQQVSSISQN